MIEAELFDGTVLEFPEGTDPAVIQRTVKQVTQERRASGGAPAPIPAAGTPEQGWEPSMVDTIMGYGEEGLRRTGYLAQEAARGVTNLVGAPVDLVNASPMLLNLLPGEQGMQPFSDNPVGGSEFLWDALTTPREGLAAAGLAESGDMQPQDRFDRIGGRVAQELGTALMPVAGGVMAGVRIGTQGARQMGGFLGRFVEPYAVNASKAAGKDLTVAAGAGSGAGIAREFASDGDPNTTTPTEAAADIVGALGGASAVGVTGAAGRAADDTARLLTGTGNTNLVRTVVADEIGRAGGAPATREGVTDTETLAAILGQGDPIEAIVPGYRPTAADVTRNPGIANLEYGRQTGPNAGDWNTRRTQNIEAANAAVDNLAPTGTPGPFRSALEQNRDAALQGAETAVGDARAAFDQAASNLQAAQGGEARGQTVRAALDEALGAAREVERQAWSAVQGEADIVPLASAFDTVSGNLTQAERLAVQDVGAELGIPRSLMPEDEAAAAAGVPVDLAEVTSLRSRLTTAQRVAEAAGDPNKARIIGQYVDAVDGFLADTGVGDALEQARTVSRDLNDRFTRRGTPTADVLATRPSGGPVVPDSAVTPQFVRPNSGQASNVSRLLRETAGVTDTAIPEGPSLAKQAVADQIIADVTSRGLLDKPDQLDAYLGQYDSVFNKFPELRTQFGNAASLRRKVVEAETAQKETMRALGEGGTSAVARYLKFGDERAVDAISTVVNAADPAKAADELVAFVGNNPAAVEGARSAFWQLLKREAQASGATTATAGGTQPWSPNALSNFLAKPANRAVMERLYADNPEHVANIETIAETLRGMNVRNTAKTPNTSGTPQALGGSAILPSAETVGSRAFAVQRGQVGVGFTAFNLISIVARRAVLRGRTQEFQKLLDEALLDPKLAAQLLKENNPANVKAMTRMAKVHLGNRVTWLDDLAGDEQEDETVSTIMGEDQ